MVSVLQIMKTARIQPAAMIQARSATRRIMGGLVAGQIARRAFMSMIHLLQGPHGAANCFRHLSRIALLHTRIAVTSVVARTQDSNATRRTRIGLLAGPRVPLAFTSMIHRSTEHLGHAT